MKLLNSMSSDIVLRPGPSRPTPEEFLELLQKHDVLIIGIKERLSREMLASIKPRTRFLGTLSIGTDHIDLDACKESGIQVFNAPTANVAAVAEHTVGALMSIRKRFPECDQVMRSGLGRQGLLEWPREIRNMHVGLVGAGRIAYSVAKILKFLGATLSAWTFHPEKHPEFTSLGTHWTGSLEELFQTTDAVSIHLPLTSKTRDLIDATLLSKIKRKPFYILNTSRADILAQGALPQALNTGTVSFAALDLIRDDESATMYPSAQTLLSPHVAGVTVESLERMSFELSTRLAEAISKEA